MTLPSAKRRAPFPRIAAFFRPATRLSHAFASRLRLPCAALPTACACACALFCLAILAVSSAGATTLGSRPVDRPAAAAPATVKLGGVSYTDARAWFVRLGYKPGFDPEARTLTLASAAGRIVLEADSRETSFHGLRVFLGDPVLTHKGALYIATLDLERLVSPILRPAQLPARPLRTIVIDAGHGGNDTGTQNKPGKLDEKVFTLDVAKRLQTLLAGSGWRVLLTRTDDRFLALPARAEFANQAGADLFISIHFNAVANNATVRGTETYVLTPQYQRSTSSVLSAADDKIAQPGNRHDAWSAVLGAHLHRQLLGKLKTQDRGLKRARFAVLRLVECPAVLVEAGYLSNDAEARKLATEAYRGDIAEALAAGIHAYAASLATAGK